MGHGRQSHRRVPGYDWYDWDTGAIDRLALAQDGMRGLGQPPLTELPAWASMLPTEFPAARPVDLARLDALAYRLAREAAGFKSPR